ncbi:hypothetical protein ACLKA6_017713 [Drosophila palustris]
MGNTSNSQPFQFPRHGMGDNLPLLLYPLSMILACSCGNKGGQHHVLLKTPISFCEGVLGMPLELKQTD